MRAYLQNCMKLCFKKFDKFSRRNKALCWSWYFKRTSKWSSCRRGKAMNSSSTLIENTIPPMQTSNYTSIFQVIETAEPQENCSPKTQDQQPLLHQNLQWKSVSGKVVSQGVARYRNFHSFEGLQIQYCR